MYACGLSSGDLVVYTGCSDAQVSYGGHDDPRGKLALGAKYIIAAIDEQAWHTRIRLDGRLEWFNSVCFEKATPA